MNPYDADGVQTFLTSYGAALATGDLDAIAECYAFPALVVHDDGTRLVPDADAVRDAFRGAAAAQHQQGLVAAVPQVVTLESTSAALLWADVRWSYRDENANERESESYRYLLRRGRDSFHICVVVPTETR